jgi:hypothetical protein
MYHNVMQTKKSWMSTPEFFKEAQDDNVKSFSNSINSDDHKSFRDSVAQKNLKTIVEEDEEEEQFKDDENQADLVTPFSIFNCTCDKIKVFRGGVKLKNEHSSIGK